MFGRISSSFINELLVKTNIVDLINSKFLLKKKGKNYYASCPFHKEKTPSFIVSEKKQYYHCFGCGVHGNVINFLMNFSNLSFIESVSELAEMHGLKIHYENQISNFNINYEKLKIFYILTKKISEYYRNCLNQSIYRKAKEYLFKRGLDEKIIDYFFIGFAPNSWNNLFLFFKKDKQKYEHLKSLGMILKGNGNYFYDFFRGRIIFPIRDLKGRVVAFGGRVLNNTNPKYINSSETDIFSKSEHLYGLYEVIKNNFNYSKLLVVEGYIDVISLTQFGINYAVSPLGTSTTKKHIELLFKITDTIICCYDGDLAGKKAAWRTLKISLPYLKDGYDIRFIFLSPGEDPDSIIRKEGKLKFEKRINTAKSMSEFLLNNLSKDINLSTCEGKTKFITFSMSFINKIPGDILRLCLFKKVAYFVGIPDISYFFFTIRKNNIKKNKKKFFKVKFITIKILIALLLQNPSFVNLIENFDEIKSSKLDGLNFFLNLVDFCRLHPGINTAQLLECYRDHKLIKDIKKLAIWDDIKKEKLEEKIFKDSLKHLYNFILNERFNFLIKKERTIGLSMNEKKEVYFITYMKK